jgi:hypothetical protein
MLKLLLLFISFALYFGSCIIIFYKYKYSPKIRNYYASIFFATWIIQASFIQVLLVQVDTFTNNKTVFKIIMIMVCVNAIVQMLFFGLSYLYDALVHMSHKGEFSQRPLSYKIIFQLMILMMLLIVPQYFFGAIYGIWTDFDWIFNEKIEISFELEDFVYFSFATVYSLHIPEKLQPIQNFISNDYHLRTLQIIQVVVNKLLELVIVGFIIARLLREIENIMNRKDTESISEK